MENPEALVEFHRDIVTEMGRSRFEDVNETEEIEEQAGPAKFTGEATVGLRFGEVWFLRDPHRRPWTEAAGSGFAPPERHFAIDLLFKDSKIVVETLNGVPIPDILPPETVEIPPEGPRASEKMTIPARELPLLGRLTLHEHLEVMVRDATLGTHNLGIDFGSEVAPRLRADPPPDQFVSHLFGVELDRKPSGHIETAEQDPRVIWDMDYAERFWILNCFVGKKMVDLDQADNGGTRAAAEVRVLDRLATRLSEKVRAEVATMKPILFLPEDEVVDPSGATSGAYLGIDALCRGWQVNGTPSESMVLQFSSRVPVPGAPALPDSILASRPTEKIALTTAGWSVLRGVREGFIQSHCLSEESFDPDLPCKLIESVGIESGGKAVTLQELEVVIEDETNGKAGRVNAHGKIKGDVEVWGADIGDFTATFEELAADMTLDDAPREPLEGEHGFGEVSLEAIRARLRELGIEKCEEARPADEIKADREAEKAKLALLPRSVGVATIPNPPEPTIDPDVDFDPLPLAIVAGIVGLISFPVFLYAGHLYAGSEIERQVADALKLERGGTVLPLAGYLPVSLTCTTDALTVYFRQIPAVLKVRCIKLDVPPDAEGDEDYVLQSVGGDLDDGMPWRLSVSDAAELITRERLSLFVHPDFAGGEEVPIEVALSPRGRRYLRSVRDLTEGNNLETLPTCDVIN
jgi:Protein of unknown function (DUF3892)